MGLSWKDSEPCSCTELALVEYLFIYFPLYNYYFSSLSFSGFKTLVLRPLISLTLFGF
jgi:hypothetical protein